MIKRYAILTSFVLLAFIGVSQDPKLIDSLRKVIPAKDDNDTSKALLMGKLAFEYSYYDLDSGLRIAEEGLKMAEITDHARSYANLYNTIGTIYNDEANYEKAIESYTNARIYADKCHNKNMLGVIYSNMANTYEGLGDLKNAKKYCTESISLFKELKDTARFAMCYMNLGVIYGSCGDTDSAMYWYNESLKQHTDNVGIVANAYSNIAAIYAEKKNYEEAKKYYEEALALIKPLHIDYYEASYFTSLGGVYTKLGNYAEAEEMLKKALEFASKDRLLNIEERANYNLYELYLAKKNYEKALMYHVKAAALNDSINSVERNKAARELEKKYQIEKKEKEISELNSEKAVAELENRRKGQLLIFAIIGGVLLICALGFAVVGFNNKKKANKQLQALNNEVSLQRNELQDKNKSITDSIHYAQRIQNVLLTSQTYIKQHLGEVFILNKPKDIVSGDFYWAVKHYDGFYLQVADCTGHGVPGAFMSLLGISFLNEIVLEHNKQNPNEILNELRSEIKKVFTDKGNTHGEMNDGMDCVLCRFDLQNKILHYAAANNNIIVIRNKEVICLDGDKMPVGKSPRDHVSFTLHEFKLQPGDILYMFSDGYPDQFGGKEGKKLKVKNVRQLLLSVSEMPFNQQQQYLNDQFENWRGNLEQVDDVLMVGVRI